MTARAPLQSVAKFVVVSLLLSLPSSRPIRSGADNGITLQMPEKCIAGGSLAIDDQSNTPPYYGNRVSQRNKSLAVLTQETYVLSDIILGEGILKRFFVYFQKPPEAATGPAAAAEPLPDIGAKVNLQIWRPEYTISSPLNKVYTPVYSISVGLNPSIGPNGTMSIYVVDKFVTVADDVMGFTVNLSAPWLPISCERNRTREVMILASPKNIQLNEEYDFPLQSVQRLSCSMAVEIVPLHGCNLCSTRKDLKAFAKKAKPQGLPGESESDEIEAASGGACMQGSLSCDAVAAIIGGILGIAVIALVALGIVQYQRHREVKMRRQSDASPSGRRRS